MTDPYMPSGMTNGADTYARQLAIRAQTAADAVMPTMVRFGYGYTSAVLVLRTSVDVPITWASPFLTADYVVEPIPGPGLVGAATLAVKSTSVAGCVITLTAVSTIAAGAAVYAHAYQ